MFFLDAILAFIRNIIELFWLPFVDSAHDRVRHDSARRERAGDERDRPPPRAHDHADQDHARSDTHTAAIGDRARDDRLDMREVLTQDAADDLEKRSRAVQSRDPTRKTDESQTECITVTDTFLSQLEQRTQQVKITLANLEAAKTRIEAQIAQLQPIVPHYDALIEAERAIAGAQIDFGAAAHGSEPPANDDGTTESGDAPDLADATGAQAEDAAAVAESGAPMGEPTAKGSNWTSYNP